MMMSNDAMIVVVDMRRYADYRCTKSKVFLDEAMADG